MKQSIIFQSLILALFLTGAALAQTPAHKNILVSQYLTQADAEKIAGQPLDFKGDQARGEKEFTGAYLGTKTRLMLNAKFEVYKNGRNAKAMFEALRSLSDATALEFEDEHPSKNESVKNIGDGAWLMTSGETRVITVLKNNVIFEIQVSGEFGSAFSLDEMKRIAGQIAQKL